ncbi:ergothioneine biosynthesis protein EgtB [Undibacterium oligocarboniphilum]|uniref:Ergothioneine biosynthesis protein EgtB n=1 Tax=Undibacterium oligocarboniphilum TaxID=666702 RepID=A0A850QGJ9_9BURK|nr:ergothioneine biosynthesis protein EgtB [Undibacterium oligocarboniphilum]MBC3870831.1 ergothioneine biosynthesis protein EgtB [Undibacterium oligocarboniphilum]NVO76545.1 ergothioneine biosynthesis protein EgtB [Undibacterium oligocarboniphilum]
MTSTDLLQRWAAVRQHSLDLIAPLSAEDCCVQSMPDASPVKWHLAHTTWFFETFILEQYEQQFQAYHPAFRMLFNSYYNDIGDKHPRPQRGLLTRPAFDTMLDYRAQVDARIRRCISAMSATSEATAARLRQLLELGIQHEQQHHELMLTDIQHLLSCNPLSPALYVTTATAPASTPDPAPLKWISYEAALSETGYHGDGFCFDNETPRHRQFTEAFALADRLISNREYLEFITDGGYRDHRLWLAEGWDWIRTQQIRHPLYWLPEPDGSWSTFTLHGRQPLAPEQPVAHLSLFEAAAFACWCDARLPTEAEWEYAATSEQAALLHDLYGARWQWTSSAYAPYPGFAPAAGAVGEYNGKFMINQYVLRGSSAFTPAGHSRATYRNFFPASTRWQLTGLRLARSPHT